MKRTPPIVFRRPLALVPALVLALAGLGAPATAQDGRPRPPSVNEEPAGAAFMSGLIGLVLTAAVLGAAGMPSKRGHQD